MLPYFLGKLKEATDGEATLLDKTLILYGSPMANANVHNHRRCPLVLLGEKLRDPALWLEALTHGSTGHERNYERLEFLGDRVLGLVVAEALLAGAERSRIVVGETRTLR